VRKGAGFAVKSEILVAFAGGSGRPLGNIWTITAKNTDFYISPVDGEDVIHLSAHGPNDRGAGHRFHIKLGNEARREVRRNRAGLTTSGFFLAHDLPRNGLVIEGQPVAPNAWLIARIRWTWDMQRPRYRAAAAGASWPTLTPGQHGLVMRKALELNEAADLDLVVSYGRPYWPDRKGAENDNAQLGPLRNASGMWLTGTTYQRSQAAYPTPDRHLAGRPALGETPSRIMGCGPGGAESKGFYWIVESITSREILDLNTEAGDLSEGFIGRAVRGAST